MNKADQFAELKAELKGKGKSPMEIEQAIQGRIKLEKAGKIRAVTAKVFMAHEAGGAAMEITTACNAAGMPVPMYQSGNEYRQLRRQ